MFFSFIFVSVCVCPVSVQIRPRLSDEKTPLREVTVEFQDACRETPCAEQQQQQQQTTQVDQPSPALIKYYFFLPLTPVFVVNAFSFVSSFAVLDFLWVVVGNLNFLIRSQMFLVSVVCLRLLVSFDLLVSWVLFLLDLLQYFIYFAYLFLILPSAFLACSRRHIVFPFPVELCVSLVIDCTKAQ